MKSLRPSACVTFSFKDFVECLPVIELFLYKRIARKVGGVSIEQFADFLIRRKHLLGFRCQIYTVLLDSIVVSCAFQIASIYYILS